MTRLLLWTVAALALAMIFILAGPQARQPEPQYSRPAEYDGTHP